MAGIESAIVERKVVRAGLYRLRRRGLRFRIISSDGSTAVTCRFAGS